MAITKIEIAIGLLRYLLLMGCFTALVLQSWQVVIDYFEYSTITTVKYREPPEHVVPPMMVFCTRFHSTDLWHEVELRNIFTGQNNVLMDSDNSWTIKEHETPVQDIQKFKYISRKFLKSSKYCMYVRVDNEFTRRELLSPRMESSFVGLPYFYYIGFGTEPLFANSTWRSNEQGCRARLAYFQVVADEGDMLDTDNPFVVQNLCTEQFRTYKIDLTFTQSTMKKLEPPYSSRCRDYNQTTIGTDVHLLNSHACFNYCLNRRLAKWNVLPDQSIIDREKYVNSSLALAYIQIIADKNKLDALMAEQVNGTQQQQLLSTYMNIYPSWERIEASCTRECEQPDCFTQKILPILFYMEAMDKNPQENLTLVEVLMRLTNDPILDVSYEPKSRLLDFFVYMTGSINFWLGVAAIQAADILESLVRKCAGKQYEKNDEARPQSHPQRVFRRMSIFDEVRRLSVVLPKPEERQLPFPPRRLVGHTPPNVQLHHQLAQIHIPTYSEYLAFIIRNGLYEPRRMKTPTEPFLPNRPFSRTPKSASRYSPHGPPEYIQPYPVDNRLP